MRAAAHQPFSRFKLYLFIYCSRLQEIEHAEVHGQIPLRAIELDSDELGKIPVGSAGWRKGMAPGGLGRCSRRRPGSGPGGEEKGKKGEWVGWISARKGFGVLKNLLYFSWFNSN
jgi:hypothetical protein